MHLRKKVETLPVKSKKTKTRDRFFNYIVFSYKNYTIIRKRTEKDIWIDLHDFPLIESDREWHEQTFLKSKEWKKYIGNTKFKIKNVSKTYKHVLSHQKIYARFWEVESAEPLKKLTGKNEILSKWENMKDFAVPRLIDQYLEHRK